MEVRGGAECGEPGGDGQPEDAKSDSESRGESKSKREKPERQKRRESKMTIAVAARGAVRGEREMADLESGREAHRKKRSNRGTSDRPAESTRDREQRATDTEAGQ